ncbi:MAG: protein-L-isoaspartate(D-aspartate) O-methyltransferase [Anaerohalosphaera sp.]|nr:protein-L-isoaspartate(D-aspartate) O-methyltransferase [Anaerohalosphaera sp.]
MVRLQLMARDITDPEVLRVMGYLPRENFISRQYAPQAYADNPLPIGLGQTISQPYIVALMTQHLKIEPDHTILELGTGSGYQTAILAKIAKKVYTIERHHQLSESAQATLENLKITNIEYYIGDGSKGYPETIKFDRIIITAAVPEIPTPLIDQLKPDGILIAPIGTEFTQNLITAANSPVGIEQENICSVKFVKLIGKNAFHQ